MPPATKLSKHRQVIAKVKTSLVQTTPLPESTPPPPKPGLITRIKQTFPAGQFLLYLCVGVWNTIFGYSCYAGLLFLYSHLLPHRYLPLTADIAYITALPLGITMSYLCYKFSVFKTHGNYLVEWLRCFAVYGAGTIPVLVMLPILTHALQRVPHFRPTAAPLLAGGIITAFTTIYSFIGHRKFSFRPKKNSSNAA
jgi:putative flippase GtrA